ncbi:MAG: ribonuclease E inhibitor RraB, partial [Plesiomonas shigelloides]
VEDGSVLVCCDVVSEIPLKAELIDAQVEQLVKLAEKFGINYDGWGTYFEDPDGEEEEDDEFFDDEDDEEEDAPTRH